MAFDIVKIVTRSRRNPELASVVVSPKNGFTIGFAKDKVQELGINVGDRFGLMVGRDSDRGKVRIYRDPNGRMVRRMNKGGIILSFGKSVKFGFAATEKAYVAFLKIDKDTIEIDLPDWQEAEAGQEDEGDPADEPEDEVEEPKPSKPQPMVAIPTSKPPSVNAVTMHGLTVDPVRHDETVEYLGKRIEITTQQCAVLLALLRTYPNVCGEDFLRKNTFAGIARADELLRQVTRSLDVMLSDEFGINVQKIGSIGFKLSIPSSK